MTTSPGIVTIISIIMAMALLAVPAAIATSSPPGGPTEAGIVASDTGFRDISGSQPPKVTAIDESFNGNTVRVARGDTLLVQLPERETYKTWQFDGGSAFKVIGDTVLETYPMRHDFRVKVLGPGDLRFKKIDRRDGFTIDTFSVKIAMKEGKPGKGTSDAYPLWKLDLTGSGIIPYGQKI